MPSVERTPAIGGKSLNDLGGGYINDFYAREFWRFVMVHGNDKKTENHEWVHTESIYRPPPDFSLGMFEYSSCRGEIIPCMIAGKPNRDEVSGHKKKNDYPEAIENDYSRSPKSKSHQGCA
jgi:hypothetical protein